jgi:hypothetical protein
MGRKTDKPSIESLQLNAAITPLEYGGLQVAFDNFNRTIFDNALNDVFITYQRRPHMLGHFVVDRYSGRDRELERSELALNPDQFIGRTDAQICSTLVHEMVHEWQYQFGKPAKRGYHNKEWAAKMKSIGLMPSNTGAVGGKETGARMSHYILPGGLFERTFNELAATGWKLNLQSAPAAGQKAPASKIKYTCPNCGLNVWAKPDVEVTCTACALESGISADAIALVEQFRLKSELPAETELSALPEAAE